MLCGVLVGLRAALARRLSRDLQCTRKLVRVTLPLPKVIVISPGLSPQALSVVHVVHHGAAEVTQDE
jgi:hypothetical protein